MFTKATDEQLLVLIKHERNIPKHLMIGIVEEYCNRRLFDNYIRYVLKGLNMDCDDDLIQQGYLYILNGLKSYKPTNSAFHTFVYHQLRNKFINFIRNNNVEKRKSNKNNLHLEQPLKDDSETTYLDLLQDDRASVENKVINKVFLEESLNLITKQQKEMLLLFGEGYLASEIARKLKVSRPTVANNITKACKLINPLRPDVTLTELNLVRGRG